MLDHRLSNDGSRHEHPDPETVACIVAVEWATTGRLLFKHESHNAAIRDEPSPKTRLHCDCSFGTNPGFLTVRLEDEALGDERLEDGPSVGPP